MMALGKKALIAANIISLILVAFSAGILVAKTQATPSVPEFTLKYIDHSYDVPPTYAVDPFTGNKYTTQEGYRVENGSIEITIANQPFSSHRDANGNNVLLFYDVQCRDNFGDYWRDLIDLGCTTYRVADNAIISVNSKVTIISFGLGESNPLGYVPWLGSVAVGTIMDFQVQAFIGYYAAQGSVDTSSGSNVQSLSFVGQSSGWSFEQTIAIPEEDPATDEITPSPTPVFTPTISSTPFSSNSATQQPIITPSPLASGVRYEDYIATIIMMGLSFAAVIVGMLVYFRRKRDKC
jgi:hypothetical protein